jgi:hypothetical protein
MAGQGVLRQRDNIPGDGPVIIDINLILGRRSNDWWGRSCMRSRRRLRSRMRQRDRIPARDIRRATQISAASVSPSQPIDNTDISRITDLPVRAALSSEWRAATQCTARVAFLTVASVRAAGSSGLDAAADGVAGVAAGAGACGAAADAVCIGLAVDRAGTALLC